MAVLLASCCAGCLTFEKRWEEAEKHFVPKGSIIGRWEGHWSDEENEERGRLRCIVTPLKTGAFEARFQAMWFSILPREFVLPLRGANMGGLWHFVCEKDFGWRGGTQRFEGKVDPARFFSSYSSPHGKGVFEMGRPN